MPLVRCYGLPVSENPSPSPIIEPDDATIVKWIGMAITVLVLVLILFLYGWLGALLAGICSFGTLMVCVGAESEQHRRS